MQRSALVYAALAASLLLARPASATTFVIHLENNTNQLGLAGETWGPGLLSTVQLFERGVAPDASSPYYPTYAFATSTCDLDDAFCPSGSCDDDGDPNVLAQRMGLTLGANAHLIPALAPGDTFDLVIEASAPDQLWYVSKVVGRDDDIIGIYEYGVSVDLASIDPGALLFDPMTGLPVDVPAFGYLSWDMNSELPDDGSFNSCSPDCPIAPPPTCHVAFRRRDYDGVILDPLPRGTFSLIASYSSGALTTDSVTMGDVQPAGAAEIVSIQNGGSYVDPPYASGNGRIEVLLQADLSLRRSYSPPDGHELLGFLLIENLIGVTPNEFVFGESNRIDPDPPGRPAAVYLRYYDLLNDSYENQWTSTPYAFPGFWNMGPSSGNVRTDAPNPGNEIILADLNGNISVLNGITGAALNTYSTFTELAEETLYGHATVANVDGLPGNEIVLMGAQTGSLYAFAAPNADGPLSLVWASDPSPNGGLAFGNGSAIGDIDGDGTIELVVVSGFTNEIYAFDVQHGTACKHRWTGASGSNYFWTSPVIGDVDGDAQREVVVFANNSVLSVLRANSASAGNCTEGQLVWEYTVGNGGDAWFTPSLGNVVGDTHLDVLVANYQTVEVVDVAARQPEYRFSAAGARFYPHGLIQPGPGSTGNPGSFFYLTGWSNHMIYRLAGPVNAPVPAAGWFTFMGDNQRTGAR